MALTYPSKVETVLSHQVKQVGGEAILLEKEGGRE